MATTLQVGVLADLVEGRARRMWPGRWPERAQFEVKAGVEAEVDRAQLVADLAELAAAEWAPLMAAVRERKASATDTA